MFAANIIKITIGSKHLNDFLNIINHCTVLEIINFTKRVSRIL